MSQVEYFGEGKKTCFSMVGAHCICDFLILGILLVVFRKYNVLLKFILKKITNLSPPSTKALEHPSSNVSLLGYALKLLERDNDAHFYPMFNLGVY